MSDKLIDLAERVNQTTDELHSVVIEESELYKITDEKKRNELECKLAKRRNEIEKKIHDLKDEIKGNRLS